jgi:hypothetical protein
MKMKKDLSEHAYRDSLIQEAYSRYKYLYGFKRGTLMSLAGNGIAKQREIVNNIWEGDMKLLLAEIDPATFGFALQNLGPTSNGGLKVDANIKDLARIKAYHTRRYAEVELWCANIELLAYLYPAPAILFIDACGTPTNKTHNVNWIESIRRMINSFKPNKPMGLLLNFSNRACSTKPEDAVKDIITKCNELDYSVKTHETKRGPTYKNDSHSGVMHLTQHIISPCTGAI